MNETIILNKFNEIHFKVNGSLDQMLELKEFLNFYIKNHKFHPKVKSKIWDGKISFFKYNERLLPIGLLNNFIEFCETFNYDYKFNFDLNEFYNTIDKNDILSYIDELTKDNIKKPRDYQIESVLSALNEKRGLIISGTGTGKSFFLYIIIRLFIEINKKVLLIVPNTGLVEQMFDDFTEYGWENKNEHVEILYSGKKPTFKKNVLISTWQSIPIKKKDDEFYENFSAVIVDETHLAKASQLQNILNKCINADYRIGTTATLPKYLTDKMNIYSVLGHPIFEYKAKQGIEDGYLSKMHIICMILKYPIEFVKRNKDRNYPMEIKIIEENDERNILIGSIFSRIKASDNIIILCRHHEHLNRIEEYLRANIKRDIDIIHGKIKTSIRNEVRKSINNKEGLIILATYDTMSTGVNVNKLHHVVLASPYKEDTKVLQAIGRGLRLHDTKDELIVWDIVDDLRRVKRTGKIEENYCWEHYEERKTSYKREGYTFIEEVYD